MELARLFFANLGGFNLILLILSVFLIAALYSSVGHGGASGYLAVLSFFAISSKEMSTTALILNILVSGIAFFSYLKAGYFSLSFSLPFVLASIPTSFLGGMLNISESTYFLLLFLVLIFAAFRLMMPLAKKQIEKEVKPKLSYVVFSGASIGLVSGIVGIGGGIFLSPLIILLGWASLKKTSSTSAFFILANSCSALLGRLIHGGIQIGNLYPLLISAFIGGLIGSYYGSRKLANVTLSRILGIVLLIAAFKLILSYMEITFVS